MDLVHHNWNFAPKKWHDAIGSKDYDKKINLTLFLKALLQTFPNDMYYLVHLDPKTKPHVIYTQVSKILKYLIWNPKKSCYEDLWDFNFKDVGDYTLLDFNETYKLQLYKPGVRASEVDIRVVVKMVEEHDENSDSELEYESEEQLVDFVDEKWPNGLPENLCIKHIFQSFACCCWMYTSLVVSLHHNLSVLPYKSISNFLREQTNLLVLMSLVT